MKFVLDTSAYSDFNRGDKRLLKWFTTSNEILLPLIVVGELRAGFAAGNKTVENEKLLQRFLDSANVRTITLSDSTTKIFAALYLQLRKAGTPMGVNDMWVASLALEHRLPVLTTDSDFTRAVEVSVVRL